jgi:hypothetical protein
LKRCADIVSHGWDEDQYCHHEGWKEVMTVWKDRQIQATIREFDEEGADSENGPFQGLALRDAIQAVRDGMQERDSRGEDNEGQGRGKPQLIERRSIQWNNDQRMK